jgi:hypothetical protein
MNSYRKNKAVHRKKYAVDIACSVEIFNYGYTVREQLVIYAVNS